MPTFASAVIFQLSAVAVFGKASCRSTVLKRCVGAWEKQEKI